MKTIGIKLADGSFYPLLEEGKPSKKSINLTTVQDNQTIVHVDVYRSETGTMEGAEYIDTLEIKDLKPHSNGEPSFNLDIGIDENNELSANIHDPETGNANKTQVELSSKIFSQMQNPPIHFEKDPTISEATSEENSGVMLDDNTLSERNSLSANQDDSPENPQDLGEDDFTISQDEIENIGFGNQNKEQEANEMLGASPNDEDFSFDLLNDEQKDKSAQENLNEEIVDDNFDFADLENSVDLNDISFDDDSNIEDIDATVTDLSDEKSDNSEDSAKNADDSDEFVASPVGIKVSKGHKHSSEKKVPSVDEVLAENSADFTGDSDATSDASAEETDASSEKTGSFADKTDSFTNTSEGFGEKTNSFADQTETSAEQSDDFSATSDSSSDQTESLDATSENSAEQESNIDLDLPDFDLSTENSDTTSDDSFASDNFSATTETSATPSDTSAATTESFASPSESFANTTDSFSEVSDASKNQTQDFSTDDVPEDFATTTGTFAEQSEAFAVEPDASANLTDSFDEPSDTFSDETDNFSATTDSSATTSDSLTNSSYDFSTDGLDDETFGIENQNDDNSSEDSKISAVGLSSAFDNDIGEPDLSTDELDDNFDANFDDSDLDSLKTKDPTFEPKNDMFSDLYDKETFEGNSSYNAEDEVKKKTKVPVIICITCAIICILAALFVLFIIPSKFNLLKKSQKVNEKTNTELENQQENLNQTEKTETELLSEVPADENQENAENQEDLILIEESEDFAETQENPSDLIEETQANFEEENSNQQVESEENSQNVAQEDEIVIAENPQNLVPKEPEPSTKTPEIIRYKIKWGDTLWDISNAYYKNPWRYKYLANYNGIKNPDYIISGTWLLIPSE